MKLFPEIALPEALFGFHHLGIAVANLGTAIPVYEKLLGYKLVSGPFDDPIQKVSVCFLQRSVSGDILIELVAPGAEQSPIQRILAKGGGPYHTCYQVAEMEASLAHLTKNGCLVVSNPVPAVAFGNRRIAWLFTPTRHLLEVLER